MPTAMKVKCFIIFFAIFVVISKAEEEIDFLDCGSYMDIEKVLVSNCSQVPCVFSPGDNLTVEVVLKKVINLNRTDLVTRAFIWMFGTRWSLDVNPLNPCSQWHCPVAEVDFLKYIANIHITDNFARRPAQLELLIDDNINGKPVQALCIEFSINLQ